MSDACAALTNQSDLDEIGIKQKIRSEITRHRKFQSGILGVRAQTVKVADIDIRNYAKYILRDGTISREAGVAVVPSEPDYDGDKRGENCLKVVYYIYTIASPKFVIVDGSMEYHMTFLNPKDHATPLSFFLKVNRGNLKLLLINMFFYGAGSLAILVSSYFLGRVVDGLEAGQPVAQFLWFVLLAIVGYEAMYRIGHVFEVMFLSRLRNRTKKALFDHTISLSFGYFADRFAGEISHKISTTADAFERMTLVMTNGFVEGAVLLVISATMIGRVHPHYAIFMAAWGAYFILGSLLIARQMHKKASAYAAEEAKTNGAFVDTYSNIGAVKVYGKSEDLKNVHAQIDTETRTFRALGIWDIVTYNFQGTSIILLSAGLVAVSSTLYRGALITIGEIVFVSGAAIRIFNYVWEMGQNLSMFIRHRGESAQNLEDLIAAPGVVDGSHPVASIQEKIAVEYSHVNFSYTPGRPVLNDFSLTIAPNEKIGIVGLSGAGKTTFANLLLRFFDPQTGAILLNGADVRNFTQEFLRSHISYISQDSSLFHTTIAGNIAYGSTAASPENIRRAAQLAYADDFIMELPQKYESIVGDRGIKLSGGQRQRIAIARAILANRPLFLLDEATSALDSDSEGKIQKGLATLMEHKTVIAISHPLSIVTLVGKISKNEIARANADKNGDWEILIPNNKIPQNEPLKVEIIKVDLTTLTRKDPNNYFAKSAYKFLLRLIKSALPLINKVSAQDTTPTDSNSEFQPILSYVEGYAYDQSGNIIANATVKVMLDMTDGVYYQTTADENGFFSIAPENLPIFSYRLEFTSPNSTNPVRTSTAEFAQKNQDHLTTNNIDLMAAIKNGESLIPTSPPSPTPIVTNETPAAGRSTFAGNRFNLMLIVIVLIVLLGVAGGILLYLKKKESQTDNLL